MALQTDDNYRGHGYASLVVKAISKRIAELGHDVYAGIFEDNIPSQRLFGKIGFRKVAHFNWIITKHSWHAGERDQIYLKWAIWKTKNKNQ